MSIMKTFNRTFNKKIFFSLLLALVFSLSLYLFNTINKVSATTQADAGLSLCLQNSKIEYFALDNPIDTASYEDMIAVTKNNKSLVISNNDNIVTIDGFDNIKQIKFFNSTTLLVLDDANIYTLDLLTYQKSQLLDTDGKALGANYFDVNERYLIRAFNTDAYVYQHTAEGFAKIENVTISVVKDYPVALNEIDEFFFIKNTTGKNAIYKTTIETITRTPILIANASPSSIIANQSTIYFISSSEVYSVKNIENSLPVKLELTDIDINFDLGNFSVPQSLSFRGENLLITDYSTKVVEEYKVDKDKLIFTGFAIAQNKTAYNRVSSTAIEVEQLGSTVAVLDADKLTIINTDFNGNNYNRDNYVNLFSQDFGGLLPNKFALGNGKILTSDNIHGVKIYDLNKKQDNLTILSQIEHTIVKDLCYQSGYFYILAYDSLQPDLLASIYKIDENSLDYSLQSLNIIPSATYSSFTMDVFGNIYFISDTKISVFIKSIGYIEKTISTSILGAKKLTTDLVGNLFALTLNGELYYLYQTDSENWQSEKINYTPYDTQLIKGISIDFNTKNSFVLVNNGGYLLSTNALPTITISDLAVPNEYKITGANSDVNALKSYSANANANVYKVRATDSYFDFISLDNTTTEYIYVCDLSITNGYVNHVFKILAGSTNIVLINELDCVEKTINVTPSLLQNAFVTTGINMYYLPIITKSDRYVLTMQDTIRLNRLDTITPLAEFTYLGIEFYYAKAIVNSNEHFGYLPKSATVKVLSKDFEWEEYSIINIRNATVYVDLNLSSSVCTLDDVNQVRLLDTFDKVYKVAYLDEDGYSIGYVSAQTLVDNASEAIRNLVVIILVTACVCATSIYFILKKKSKN